MSIPTVNVTAVVHDTEGCPVENVRVVAKLTTLEKYNGFVVPERIEELTDATGTAVLALWPNELGSEGSEYKFKIQNPETGKTDTMYGTVPNMDCNLHQILDLPPYDRQGAGLVISEEIAANAAAAEAAQVAAETAETNAEAAQVAAESAQTASETAKTNAETAESNAAESALAASGSASDAAVSASEASDSAAEAAQSAEAAAAAAGMSVYGASLVDDEDAAEARSTLGLGNSATKDTGTGSDDVATGNHTHAVGTIVGIGDSASKDVGTGSDEVAAGNHAHDDTYYTETEVDGFLAGKSDTSHTHDSRYYTETETDSLLSGKSDTSHDHDSDYIATTAKGAASGVAELDAGGKIPTAQIPDSVLHSMEYKGSFDASGGAYPSPAELEAGWYYVCNVAGTISGTPYANGDWAVYNGTSWDKIDNNAVVSSVAGRTGAVVLTTSDVGGLGNSATRDVGTGSGNVAQGDHGHTGVYEPADPDILKKDTSAVLGAGYFQNVTTISPFGASPTIDLSSSNMFVCTLAPGATFPALTPSAAGSWTFRFSGSYALALASGVTGFGDTHDGSTVTESVGVLLFDGSDLELNLHKLESV